MAPGITILDGGMGQELLRRSGDTPHYLWATEVMRVHPGLVAEIHKDYFDAGAEIATTNTYAIHRDRLVKEGVEDQFEAFIDMALGEAEKARSAHGSGRIAGSIGPLVASYRPETHPDHETAVPLYAELARRLAAGSDLILCETVASVAHACAITEGAIAGGLPVWVALTVDDEDGTKLRSGEPVVEAAQRAVKLGAETVLANCSAPEAMNDAVKAIGQAGVPCGAYANGFEQITKAFVQDNPTAASLSARRDMGPERYGDIAETWVKSGATVVGGCCETGPDHIAELKRRFG